MSEPVKFRVYPRGFVGIDVTMHVYRSPSVYSSIYEEQLQRSQEAAAAGNIQPNPHVSNLHSTYLKHAIPTNTWEFREKVLLTAMGAFGLRRFDKWFELQFKTQTVGELHGRFLNDTIDFIQTGRREMPIDTWSSILRITDEGDSVGVISKDTKEFLGLDGREHAQRNLVDILQLWVSKPNGTEDLIGTLNILFGNVD